MKRADGLRRRAVPTWEKAVEMSDWGFPMWDSAK